MNSTPGDRVEFLREVNPQRQAAGGRRAGAVVAVSLHSLRIDAILDPSKYVAGANQKSAADDKMVGSGRQLAGSIEQTDRRLGKTGIPGPPTTVGPISKG
jgi:hypothetical protein